MREYLIPLHTDKPPFTIAIEIMLIYSKCNMLFMNRKKNSPSFLLKLIKSTKTLSQTQTHTNFKRERERKKSHFIF